MSGPKLADLIDEYNEIKGTIRYKLSDKRLFDKTIPQIVLCEKSVGHSHFSLIRNEDFELIFTYQNSKKTYRSTLDLNTYHPIYDTILFLNWGPDYCELYWDVAPGCCENF